MNNTEAKRIANEKNVNYGELKQILARARVEIKDWKVRSRGNPTFSRGFAFNIFAKGLKGKPDTKEPMIPFTRNILREFGEYSKYAKSKLLSKKTDVDTLPINHQEPMEFDYDPQE